MIETGTGIVHVYVDQTADLLGSVSSRPRPAGHPSAMLWKSSIIIVAEAAHENEIKTRCA